MPSTSLYVKEGDILRPRGRGTQYGWRVIREVGKTAIPSPLGRVSICLPTVVGLGPDAQEKFFQQVSPKFWLMLDGVPKGVWYE